MDNLIEKMNDVINDFSKLNNFVLDMFNDVRIPPALKSEYAERYNKLNIHKLTE